MLRKIFIGIVLLAIAYSCLEPYQISIDGYDNLLIVDGSITDENKSHTILLKRSTTDINESSPLESGATVFVTDQNGVQYYFAEFEPGTYKSDSTDLRVKEGDKFTLHISTADGNNYRSTECEILPKTEIDEVYYGKNIKWDANDEKQNEGLSIYIDGRASRSSFLKWEYEEDWKFRVPYPERFVYTENEELTEITSENVECWKEEESNSIHLFSFSNQIGNQVTKQEIVFIPTKLSDKLSVRYSILVKQYTISKEEFEYWRKLSESTEDVGDVFGKQPFSLRGNIINVNNEYEPVLGYFQVGSVDSKRIFINNTVIYDLSLPSASFAEGCFVDTFRVDGLRYGSPYEIYTEYVLNGSMSIYEPLYANDGMTVIGLLLAHPNCADCTFSGVNTPPLFWED